MQGIRNISHFFGYIFILFCQFCLYLNKKYSYFAQSAVFSVWTVEGALENTDKMDVYILKTKTQEITKSIGERRKT